MTDWAREQVSYSTFSNKWSDMSMEVQLPILSGNHDRQTNLLTNKPPNQPINKPSDQPTNQRTDGIKIFIRRLLVVDSNSTFRCMQKSIEALNSNSDDLAPAVALDGVVDGACVVQISSSQQTCSANFKVELKRYSYLQTWGNSIYDFSPITPTAVCSASPNQTCLHT